MKNIIKMAVESKTIRKFAWIPNELDSGKIIWLKHYNIEYIYEEYEEEDIIPPTLPFMLPFKKHEYSGLFFITKTGWNMKRKYI